MTADCTIMLCLAGMTIAGIFGHHDDNLNATIVHVQYLLVISGKFLYVRNFGRITCIQKSCFKVFNLT